MRGLLHAYLDSGAVYAVVFVLGAALGSFANVCIARLPPTPAHPRGRSIIRPRSHCLWCGATVRWRDNIPVLSYLLLRGRCRDCAVAFSPRYLFVEAAMGMLFVALFHAAFTFYPDESLSLRLTRFAILAAYVFVLVVIAFIDLEHKLILDRITYPAIPIAYGLGLLLPERTWWEGLVGAAVGYLVVRLISDGYYYATGREGLGYGDGKLLAMVGALHGWKAVAVTLFGGSLVGSVIGVSALLVARRSSPDSAAAEHRVQSASDAKPAVPLRHAELPFGPFLVVAALAYTFAHPWLPNTFAHL